jgi:transcriptional antiterminator RfaH
MSAIFNGTSFEEVTLERDWYVVYTKPHKEEQVRFHLGAKGLETFFPRLQRPGRNSPRCAITSLFPNYLFVRCNLSLEAQYVVWSPGLKRIVSFGDQPVPLDDSVVQFLKSRADAKGIIRAHSRLHAGQKVEISGGPFDGFSAIIEQPPNAQGRVKVLLKLLSRPVRVKLDVASIRGQSISITPANEF